MGFFKQLKEAWLASVTFDKLDDEFYDQLEEALILADMGVESATDAVAKLRKKVKERLLTRADEVKDALRAILAEKLEVGDAALNLSTTPSIVLFIGVNGVGKTTSIGKLAAQLKAEGKKVPAIPSVPPPPTSWRSGLTAPVWTSSARTRAPTPAPCCSTPYRPPRPGAWTWCCATRRAACTTSRI